MPYVDRDQGKVVAVYGRQQKADQEYLQDGHADLTPFQAETLADAARNECRRRIIAVADAEAQMNMASAAAAGLLNDTELTTYQSGVGWVASMRGTWQSLADSGADIYDDANWPSIPAGVEDLAALF